MLFRSLTKGVLVKFTGSELISHHNTLMAYAYKRTNNRDDALDLVQTTYMRAIRHNNSYQNKEYENLGTIPEGVAFAVTLGNKLVLATDPQYKFLATPELSGSGVLYDDDNVFVYGDENTGWKCRYYSEGWAEGGVCPVMFAEYGVDLVEGD